MAKARVRGKGNQQRVSWEVHVKRVVMYPSGNPSLLCTEFPVFVDSLDILMFWLPDTCSWSNHGPLVRVSWQRPKKERDNNGTVIPFHTFPAFCITKLRLFVTGHAGCRSLALALVAAYAKLVRYIFAEAFNFARFRCMTIFAVLE